jgi:hypothetical protein
MQVGKPCTWWSWWSLCRAWRATVELYRQGETPDSSTIVFWQSYQQTCSSESGGSWRRKWWIWPSKYIFFILRRDFLYVVKSYNMGPTALLPLWRKVCSGFLPPLKIQRPRSGLKPRNLDPIASTLLDHWGDKPVPSKACKQCIMQISCSLLNFHKL